MRTEPEGVVFLLFHLDPVGDEVGVEDVAFEQKRVIGFERLDRAAQRIGNARHLREFFRRQFVEVLVERIAGIDAVLDSIEAGEKSAEKAMIGIRRRIRRAELDAL